MHYVHIMWIGYATLPIGVNECVNMCVQALQ